LRLWIHALQVSDADANGVKRLGKRIARLGLANVYGHPCDGNCKALGIYASQFRSQLKSLEGLKCDACADGQVIE
jgi:hypothetical protein